MSRRRSPDAPLKGRLQDLSRGMVDAVHPALLNDAESVLLENVNLDEKGTLKPVLGRVERYVTRFDDSPCAGMGVFVPPNAPAHILVGTESGRLYHDTSQFSVRYDSKVDFDAGTHSNTHATGAGILEPVLSVPSFSRNSTAFDATGALRNANQPRYTSHRIPNSANNVTGLMVERGTTNLLSANQASVETDLSGFQVWGGNTMRRATEAAWHGSASVEVTNTGRSEIRIIAASPVAPSTQYTYSAQVLGIEGSIGRTTRIQVAYRDSSGIHLGWTDGVDFAVAGTWARGSITHTSPSNAASCEIHVFVMGAATNERAFFDGLQLETMSIVTSWQLPPSVRGPETLLLPSNVFNASAWSIEGFYTPVGFAGTNRTVFRYGTDANNHYSLSVGTSSQWIFSIVTNGVARTITSANNAVVGGTSYLWQIGGNGATMQLCVNNAQVGQTTYTVPVVLGDMLFGNVHNGTIPADGTISNIRITHRFKSLAEHQTQWAAAQALTLSDAMYLLPCNGNLTPQTPAFQWDSPIIDTSPARSQQGVAILNASTPPNTSVVTASRSAPTSGGAWSAWVNANADGTLAHPLNTFVQIRLTLNVSGVIFPTVDVATLVFGAAPRAVLLASDFTPRGQFYFASLLSMTIVVNGLNAPRRYNGTTLTTLAGSPPNARYVMAHKNYMFMANTTGNPSRLFFSDLLNPESWPILNFIDVSPNDGDFITGLMAFDDYLVITKQRSVWALFGSGPSDFSVRRMHDNVGCVAPRSLTRAGGMLAFVSYDGVYMSDMAQAVLVTKRIEKTWGQVNRSVLRNAVATFYDNKLRVDLPTGTDIINNLRIVHDGLRDAIYLERMSAHASCYVELVEGDDAVLLMGHSHEGHISRMDSGTRDGARDINFSWESKHFDFGADEHIKRWRQIFLSLVPAATATKLEISFVVNGIEPTQSIPVIVNGDVTRKVHIVRLLPSQAGVVQGHSIAFRVKQSTANGGVGVHGIVLEYFMKGARPTL